MLFIEYNKYFIKMIKVLSLVSIRQAFGRRKLPAVLLGVVLGMAGSGCTRKVYVPVERVEVRSDSLRSVRVASDSVVVRDSVYIVVRGDSVLERRVSERTRVAVLHDTVVRRQVDTVRVEVPVPVGEPDRTGKVRKRSYWLWPPLLVGVLAALLFIRRRWKKLGMIRKGEK